MTFSQRVSVYVILGVIVAAWLILGDVEMTPRESVEVRSWLSLAQVQQKKLQEKDSIRRRDSVEFAQMRNAWFRRKKSLEDSIRHLSVTPDTSTAADGDTVKYALIARASDAVPFRVPLFLAEGMSAQWRMLDSAGAALNQAEIVVASYARVQAQLKLMVRSRDSVIAVRDQRIVQLSKRKLTDYIHTGCQYGFRGADCGVGVRIPFGR